MSERTRQTDCARARVASWPGRWPVRAEAHCGTPGPPLGIALAQRTCRHAPDNEPSEPPGSESNRPRPAVQPPATDAEKLNGWCRVTPECGPFFGQVFAQKRGYMARIYVSRRSEVRESERSFSVGWIIFPHYAPDVATELRPVSRPEELRRLPPRVPRPVGSRRRGEPRALDSKREMPRASDELAGGRGQLDQAARQSSDSRTRG